MTSLLHICRDDKAGPEHAPNSTDPRATTDPISRREGAQNSSAGNMLCKGGGGRSRVSPRASDCSRKNQAKSNLLAPSTSVCAPSFHALSHESPRINSCCQSLAIHGGVGNPTCVSRARTPVKSNKPGRLSSTEERSKYAERDC